MSGLGDRTTSGMAGPAGGRGHGPLLRGTVGGMALSFGGGRGHGPLLPGHGRGHGPLLRGTVGGMAPSYGALSGAWPPPTGARSGAWPPPTGHCRGHGPLLRGTVGGMAPSYGALSGAWPPPAGHCRGHGPLLRGTVGAGPCRSGPCPRPAARFRQPQALAANRESDAPAWRLWAARGHRPTLRSRSSPHNPRPSGTLSARPRASSR